MPGGSPAWRGMTVSLMNFPSILGPWQCSNPVGWRSLALSRGIGDPDDLASLQDGAVLSAVRDKVNHLLSCFPAWEKVRRVHLMLAPWTIESGLVTPTLKPRRREPEDRFTGEIAALYRDTAPNR